MKKEKNFMRIWKAFFAVVFLPVFLGGCIYVVAGSVGALGGYIVSPDTVEGLTEADLAEVWDTAVEVVSIMGLIEQQTEAGGMIRAKVSGAKVTLLITQPSASTVKLKVKVRKGFLPKVSLAQDIFVKIMSRVGG